MSDAIRIIRAESDADFDQAFAIRSKVFGDELGIDEEVNFDGLEHLAHHYLALIEDKAVGTIRWRQGPMTDTVRIERVAVLAPFRNQKVGSMMLTRIMEDVPPNVPVIMTALPHLVPFYAKSGFFPEGEPFEYEGMVLQELRFQHAE